MEVALQSSVWVTSPEFAGWLTKRGFHWRKLWKKRWVALHGAEIVYMDKEPTFENSSSLTITKAQINDGHSPTWYLRAESSREKKSWLMRLAHVHAIVKWLEDFEKVRILGVGGTGIVYELLHKTNGQRYAMKEMEIKNKAQMEMAIQEAEMLKDIMEHVSHPNIMHIEKVFQVGSKFYLVFPLCTGGELYEHIIRQGHFTEYDASVIIRDLISGLHALHSHEILHLDIKPENILFENNEIDAKIKITDFGLSKMFSNGNEGSRMPTMDEINEKLKAFQESGVLDRDRLRGTVGYMAPELILTGHSSKATDVFAAGVVLYILLCGHPPFQSKSNREVLEKTAKGQYKMDGDEWEGISDEAKDLVRKMLVVDPSKRITTTEILAHSWLRDDTEGTEVTLPTNANPMTIPDTSNKLVKKFTSSKRTNVNLANALHLLSSHVTQTRTQKLASGFTKLVTTMQGDSNNRSALLRKFVRPNPSQVNSSSSSGNNNSTQRNSVSNTTEVHDINNMIEEETIAVMNPDIKEALASAIQNVGNEGGKLTIPQFVAILKQLVGGNSVSAAVSPTTAAAASSANPTANGSNGGNNATGQGLAFILLCRFVDRDGDGFISADDIFTSQALVAQRSDLFLRAVFRIYSEAIWYPGRQMNFVNLLNKATPKKGAAPSSGNNKVLDESWHVDIVEPPKHITARHVASIFEKLGFDPQGGQQLFLALYEALMKANNIYKDSSAYMDEVSNTPYNESLSRNDDGFAPREAFIDRPIIMPSPDVSIRKTNIPPGASQSGNSTNAPNAALASAFGLMSFISPSDAAHAQANNATGTRNSSVEEPTADYYGSSAINTSLANAKMDVNDFIRACDIDDALVQVLLYRPRTRMKSLFRQAQGLDNPPVANIVSVDETTRRHSSTALLENELLQALRNVNDPARESYPIAKAVTRSALSAAIGLTASVTRTAQHIMEATMERMEGGDDSIYTGEEEDDEDDSHPIGLCLYDHFYRGNCLGYFKWHGH